MQITEDLLMAYADGEADSETRAAVEAAMARDGAIRERVEAHRRLRGTMAGAFRPSLSEPVPERLLAAARGERSQRPSRPAEIVDLAAVRARKTKPKAPPAPSRAWLQWAALAACVVVGVFVARGLGQPGVTPMIGDRHGELMAQGALARALDLQIAGQEPPPNPVVRIGVSFHSADRTFCRTFQVLRGEALAGVACRAPNGWQVRATAASTGESVNAGGYRTAASPLPPAVTATVDAIIAGSPLDAQAEAAAKAKDWRE
ncbi:MAG TPA: zf-HC2 domain-containing protein [Caulobacteraceae bacterium]|jgi:hypothetical protein|nr:zf-HC2 domain-containing protein [Caulobacteraceae bacterium]